MSCMTNGLPNNGLAHVLGRAYAAPGEKPPAMWRGGWWIAPAAAAGAAVCVVEVLTALW